MSPAIRCYKPSPYGVAGDFVKVVTIYTKQKSDRSRIHPAKILMLAGRVVNRGDDG